MKKPFLLILIASLQALSAMGQNLLNPGFEASDPVSGSRLSAWVSNPASDVDRDDSIRYSGNASIRIRAGGGKKFGAFSQFMEVSPDSGLLLRKYGVRGFLKRQEVEQFAGIWINVFAGEISLFFDNMYAQALKGTADWMEIGTSFYLDGSATRVQIGGLLVGTGTVWFDDLSITEIPFDPDKMPDSIRTYLSEAADLIETRALHRDSVEWPKAREQAFLIASDAVTYLDCYPAIRFLLNKLGDHHSFLMPAQASKAWSDPKAEAYKEMPLATGKIIGEKYALLAMPPVSSGSEKANTYFADQLHQLIKTLDRENPQGWIIDLRSNSGGNCWPMLAGIGPILGEGACGYFMTPDGKLSDQWYYRKGKSGIGKEALTSVSRKPVRLHRNKPPVAVLTGPQTASSGEVVVVAFRGRPNTRSFGLPTAGLSTGNENFTLRDGAQIFLTTAIYTDRNKVRYGAAIVPDVQTESTTLQGSTDTALEAALKWLNGLDNK
jgi:carboxyl-terminal processing protease